MFFRFTVLRYNRNNPYPARILFLDKGLYDFEMLELHTLSSYYTNRIDEGARAYWLMRQQLKELGPDYLNEEQMLRITGNEKFFPKIALPIAPTLANQQKVRGNNFTQPKKKRK